MDFLPYRTAFLLLGASLTFAGDAAVIDFGITAISQTANGDKELSASTDLVVTGDLGPGIWTLYVESSSTPKPNGISTRYPQANADAGSALNASGHSRIQVSELHYTVAVTDAWWLTAGLIDTAAFIDRSRITNDETRHFLGATFINNPSINFPDYTLGLALDRPLDDAGSWGASLVIAGSDGLADNPQRSYGHLLRNDSGEGIFSAFAIRKRLGHQTVRGGAWINTRNTAAIDGSGRSGSGHGAFFSSSHRLAEHISMDSRLGIADPDFAEAAGFMSLAGLVGPPAHQFGLAWSNTYPSGKLGPSRAKSQQIEAFYRWTLFQDVLQVTPSMQYIDNPNLVEGESAVIASLRVQFNWHAQRP